MNDHDWAHQEDTYVKTSPSGSKLKRMWTLLPWNEIVDLLEVMELGEVKYPGSKWKQDPYTDHYNHALEHLIAAWNVENSDDVLSHLSHAAVRIMFAMQTLKGLIPDE